MYLENMKILWHFLSQVCNMRSLTGSLPWKESYFPEIRQLFCMISQSHAHWVTQKQSNSKEYLKQSVRVVATTTTYIRSILFSRAIHTKAYIASYTVMQLMTLWFLIKNISFFHNEVKSEKWWMKIQLISGTFLMKGKRIFREKFKGKKRSKLSFLFDDSLFI